MKKLACLVMLTISSCSPMPAFAREGGNWSQVDPEVRAWIQTLTRPDYPGAQLSCCGEADAYYADLGEAGDDGKVYAVITDSRGNPLPVGTKVEIPPNKIQNTEGNPSGHVVVFIGAGGFVFCFVPNGTG